MCSAQYLGSSHALAHAILKFNTHQMHVQCNGSLMGRLRYNCNGSHLVYLCRDRISAASVNHVRGKSVPGRTRTCNLWFRRPTPYPLGHRAACRPGCRRQAVITRNLDQSRAPTLRTVARLVESIAKSLRHSCSAADPQVLCVAPHRSGSRITGSVLIAERGFDPRTFGL